MIGVSCILPLPFKLYDRLVCELAIRIHLKFFTILDICCQWERLQNPTYERLSYLGFREWLKW
jgi:hypothetical protein